MSRPSQRKKPKLVEDNLIEIEENGNGTYSGTFIPNSNDSGDSDSESESEPSSNENRTFPKTSYRNVLDNYEENQIKLAPHHNYEWQIGEKVQHEIPVNETLLTDKNKKFLRNLTSVQLFELYFCKSLKNYILESTQYNGLLLSLDEFDIFLGIIITATFNERKSERDFWSTNELLHCAPIASAMGRDRFMKIKRNMKLSKPVDEDSRNKIWRVRKVLEIFRSNCVQFGFFSTALAVDEMMIKFHGRAPALQFMPNKPDRFGIKMWGICSVEGYLFDCDIYCGQGSNIYSSDNQMKLSKCAVGSRVVMLMVQKLLSSVGLRKIGKYNLYCDNYFTSPDLFVHLKEVGILATGTVRVDRVKEKMTLDKKAKRGTYVVKEERNSGMNFITVMDSKPVSILSTAAGVTPLHNVQRFSKESHSKDEIPFPMAFRLYNTYMGGVDQHDAHCSNLRSCISGKKWTWAVFCRLLQSSITNATVLRNLMNDDKIGTKQMALDIAQCYLAKSKAKKIHESMIAVRKKQCENFQQCSTRTQKMCKSCGVYSCSTCFTIFHK